MKKRLDRLSNIRRIRMEKASTSETPAQAEAERKTRCSDNADRLRDATNRLNIAVQQAINGGKSTQVSLTLHLSHGEIRQSDVRSEDFTRYV